MCGRYTQRTKWEILAEFFDTPNPPGMSMKPRYNIKPFDFVPIVRMKDNEREMVTVRWELLPFWSKTKKIKFRTHNARADRIRTAASFREPFKKRRCLIPADGVYEWKKQEDGEKKKKGEPAFFFHLKDDSPFALAGVWDHWKGVNEQGQEEELTSCSIITTDPNELFESLPHDRMPVILDKELHDIWLDHDVPTDEIFKLLKPYPSSKMERYCCGNYVNTGSEGPKCIEPASTQGSMF